MLYFDECGPAIASELDGRELLKRAMQEHTQWIVIPARRLGDAFSTLSTGLAGAIVQRLQNHGCGLAVLDDVERHAAASTSFGALVAQSNRIGGRGNLFYPPSIDTPDGDPRVLVGARYPRPNVC